MVDPTAQMGEDVSLGDGVVIGANAQIGDGVELRSGVVVYEDTVIGAGCTVYDNAVLGRPPQGISSMVRRVKSDLPALSVGAGCVIGGCSVLYRGSTIGEQTLIGDIASIREECVVGAHCIVARGVTVNYKTRIGDRVKIMDNSHITGNMLIEDDAFFGPGVMTANDPHPKCPKSEECMRGPTVRRGAIVGANATLMPFVDIGEHAIVGSGAVVMADVPPRVIALGVPARDSMRVELLRCPFGYVEGPYMHLGAEDGRE